ncbi:MAG: hypothetical protein KDB27_31380 [Planctomycetales bacterium]|nr:hypothetical protein [Planctomycetales bacterium]
MRVTRAVLHARLSLIESILQFLLATEPTTVKSAVRTLNERVQDIIVPPKSRRTRNASEDAADEELAEEPVAIT